MRGRDRRRSVERGKLVTRRFIAACMLALALGMPARALGPSDGPVCPQLDAPSDVCDRSSSVNGEDIRRVLRWAIAESAVPTSFLRGEVDPHRVAIAGHSLGGYLATFAAVRAQSEGPQL